MRFVAVYNSQTGDITALCGLPPSPSGLSAGMQMRPGESMVEFDAPEEFATAASGEQLHDHMQKIIETYKIEGAAGAKPVRKAAG